MKTTIVGFLIPIFTLSFLIASAGGGGSIKGNLVDEYNQPVPFAHVYLKVGGVQRGTTTYIDGKFTLKPFTA